MESWDDEGNIINSSVKDSQRIIEIMKINKHYLNGL